MLVMNDADGSAQIKSPVSWRNFLIGIWKTTGFLKCHNGYRKWKSTLRRWKMSSLVEEYGDRRMLEGRIQEAVESALEYGFPERLLLPNLWKSSILRNKKQIIIMNSSICSLYKRIKRQVGPLREEWAFVHFADGAFWNPFPKRWELGLLKLVKAG